MSEDPLSISEARQDFAELVNRVAYRGDRVVIARRGRSLAAVVPVEDLELLEALEDEHDVRAFDEAQAVDDGERVSIEELRAELGTRAGRQRRRRAAAG